MAGIPWDEIDDEQLWAHLTIARGVDPGTAVPPRFRPGDAKRQRRVSGDPLFYDQDEGEAPRLWATRAPVHVGGRRQSNQPGLLATWLTADLARIVNGQN
jgi:hypothetical protein